MPELRRDVVTGRWVIISTDRQKRPHDFRFERAAAIGREQCPFCPGHEAMTPPEVLSYRQNGGAPNAPGWDVRVVPNKFPSLQVEGTLDREGEGMFDRMNGIGAHEVIIETPDHDRSLAHMAESEIERVLWAFRERILDLKQDHRLRYILVFKNHGAAAGATLEHPHSQLIALPIVPDFVREEIEGAQRHFDVKERCVFCDIVHQEMRDGRRVIQENADVVALAPYAPVRVRDVAAADAARRAVRRGAAPRVRKPCASAEVGVAATRPRARVAAVQSDRSYVAILGQRRGCVSLAHRDHAEAHARGRVRVGDRVLHQPDVAGGSREGPACRPFVGRRS
jgi:galactose-1-phosphate uridylyltransferase